MVDEENPPINHLSEDEQTESGRKPQLSSSVHSRGRFLSLLLEDKLTKHVGFSPEYLTGTVITFVSSLVKAHHVIDEMLNRPLADIRILAIRYGSVSIDVTGGIRETIELILNNLVSWRRENHKKLKELEVSQKEVEIKQKEIEIEQAKATVASEVLQAENKGRLVRAQALKQELENQKMQLELVKLALEMVDQVNPDIPEEQRLLFALKMLDSVRLLATSPLEIMGVSVIEGDIETKLDEAEEG